MLSSTDKNTTLALRSNSVHVVEREIRAHFYSLFDSESLRVQLTRAVYRTQTCAIFPADFWCHSHLDSEGYAKIYRQPLTNFVRSRKGDRAVEGSSLENRFSPLGRIPPPVFSSRDALAHPLS